MSDDNRPDTYFFIWATGVTGLATASIVQKPWLPKEKTGVDTNILFKKELDPDDKRTLHQLMNDYPCPKG